METFKSYPSPILGRLLISVQMLLYPICPMSVEWTYLSIWINACVEYISRCKIASFCPNCCCLSFSNPLLLHSFLPHLCLFYFSVLMPLFRMVLWVCLLFLPWKAGLSSLPSGISEGKGSCRQLVWSPQASSQGCDFKSDLGVWQGCY